MNCITRAYEVFELEIQQLKNVSNKIDESVEGVARLIYDSKNKVVVTGIGKSGLIGKKIAASMASTGTNAIFLNAAEAVHGDLGMVCRGDCVIAISNSGASTEILSILDTLKTLECPLVAMTGNRKSELAQRADFILDTGVEREADRLGLVPTASTTAALVMGDALTVCLMELRGFQPENFGLYHPGGALGRRLLTKVRDRMEMDVPRVHEDSLFKDIVYEVSSKRLGVTMVLDAQSRPVGVITDGDIRRAIQNFDDIRTVRARDFMTRSFKWILPDVPIHDALEIMDIHKITTLAVLAENVAGAPIVGILSIHHIFDFKRKI